MQKHIDFRRDYNVVTMIFVKNQTNQTLGPSAVLFAAPKTRATEKKAMQQIPLFDHFCFIPD